MRWISDPTRRFSRRPVYERDEMEAECCEIMDRFVRDQHQELEFPISTRTLSKVVESLTADLDDACDLAWLGDEVEGATKFSLQSLPSVMIGEQLLGNDRRRRMTIAHELGHVHFHAVLYRVEYSYELFTQMQSAEPVYCKRDGISRGVGDWMEWQASYAGGALLMPKDRLKVELQGILRETGAALPLKERSRPLLLATQQLADAFDVSLDAARVRLSQLGYVEPQSVTGLPGVRTVN